MLTFKKAEELAAKARDKNRGKVMATATTLRFVEGGDPHYALRYHNTDVLKLFEDDSYQVETGGFYTKTTAERVQEYSPVKIVKREGVWLIEGHAFRGPVRWKHGKATYLGDSMPEKEAMRVCHLLKHEINKYVKAFAKKMAEGKIERPSGGDCWQCLGMFGERCDHLFTHLAERYHVPSLLFNAFKERANGNEEIAQRNWMYCEGTKTVETSRRLRRFFANRRQNMVFEFDEVSFKSLRDEARS